MAVIPQVRKKLGAFLIGEEGKITKEAIFKIGAVVGAIAVATKGALAGHSNFCNHGDAFPTYPEVNVNVAKAEHSDGCGHQSHAHHGSHHSSWH